MFRIRFQLQFDVATIFLTMWLKIVFLVGLLVVSVSGSIFPIISSHVQARAINNTWWKRASFYQIYPRSFKDSDGDGVGDLKGIVEKLPYLKEIGITAAWLSPIYPSPMADFGYDISNFTDIDPIFGDMEDFDNLMAKANEIGLKIIMDFVPNHTSDESIWFQKSVARDPEFEDFYFWHPGKLVNGKRQPPTNWMSAFRGNAWEWNEQRQEYYYHQFVTKQPDLNYRNPKVKEYMNEVLKFWLRKGVAGFRCDAVPNVFEISPDANGNYPDEPRNNSVDDPEAYNYVQHIYTSDQPETTQLVYEWRKLLDDFKIENGGEDRILMIESYSPIEVVMEYYGNKTHDGAQIPFNFQLITYLTKHADANYYSEIINLWLDKMPKEKTANWVLGNHDRSRVGSRMGTDRIDMMHMLVQTLPGCSVTYQGEEIGMTDVWISWNDTVDPQACNSNPDIYLPLSRDASRTPFQWSDEKNAGFSNGSKTWLPVSELYHFVNVKRECKNPFSHFNVFKQLQNLRSERTLREGDTEVKAISETVLAIKRSLPNDYTFITLANIMDDIEIVNLNSVFANIPKYLEYVVVNDNRKDEKTFADQILLLPKESVVLRTMNN